MNLSAVINLQLVMFALFICGFVLTKKGIMNGERRKGMSDLLIDLFLPISSALFLQASARMFWQRHFRF